MSLLKSFLEYHDKEVIEKPYGFIAYKVLDDEEFFITDLFIEESERGKQKALELCLEAERLAKSKECKFLKCEIYPREHTISHTNWLVLKYMQFGFSIVNAQGGAIVLMKGLGGK